MLKIILILIEFNDPLDFSTSRINEFVSLIYKINYYSLFYVETRLLKKFKSPLVNLSRSSKVFDTGPVRIKPRICNF